MTMVHSNLLSTVAAILLLVMVHFKSVSKEIKLLKSKMMMTEPMITNAVRTNATNTESVVAVLHAHSNANDSTMHAKKVAMSQWNGTTAVDALTNDNTIKSGAGFEELIRNTTMSSILHLNVANTRRAQFQEAPVDQAFLTDLHRLHSELSDNYSVSRSGCRRVKTSRIKLECFGLGTTVGRINRKMVRYMMDRNQIFSDIDRFTCGWFARDKKRSCSTMFGDCYFPALTTRGRSNHTQSGVCHDIRWFYKKYGYEGLYAGHFSWLLGDSPPTERSEPQSCIALHIRRGDACINSDRQCFDYDTYYEATRLFVEKYPHLQRLVVLTDADDFPLSRFQSLVKEVSYAAEVNRSKYNVNHLRNESNKVWSPEFRNLDNATSELLEEVAQASHCTALVGTFTAGISKWIFLNLLTRQGRVPLFYSLQGCIRNAWASGDYFDEGCDSPIQF